VSFSNQLSLYYQSHARFIVETDFFSPDLQDLHKEAELELQIASDGYQQYVAVVRPPTAGPIFNDLDRGSVLYQPDSF